MQQRIEMMFDRKSRFDTLRRSWAIGLMTIGLIGLGDHPAIGQFRDVTPRSEAEEDHEPLSPQPMDRDVQETNRTANPSPTKKKTAGQGSKTGETNTATKWPVMEQPSEEELAAAKKLAGKELAQQQAKANKQRERELKKEIESTLVDDTEVRQLPFRRITVGKSTEEDVIEAWGEPFKEDGSRRSPVLKYRLDPFRQVDVTLTQDKVRTILIHLDGLLSPEQIEQQLRMTKIRPAVVRDDYGRAIGLVYPERGVLLSFDASDPDALIAKIQLEPISIESFLLRASNHRGQNYEANLADLQTALKIDPENARAHWIRAKQFADAGRYHNALGSSAKATHFDPENIEYRLTRVNLMAINGSRDMALREARMILEQSGVRPETRAATTCLVGELIAGSQQSGSHEDGDGTAAQGD